MLYVSMEEDLKNLKITRRQRKELIGDEGLFSLVDSNNSPSKLKALSIIGVLLVIFGISAYIIFGFSSQVGPIDIGELVVFVLGMMVAGWVLIWSVLSFMRSIEYRQAFEHLSKLFGEVKKHNKIVKDIHVLDQLRDAGNPVGLSDREQVLEAMHLTRDHLVRAFRTERILRENPDFKREQFRIDLTAYHALQVSEEASDYGRLLDDALQIGVEVQEEMVKLLQERTSE